ncbi:uncharacterized protein LOC124819215 [Hydra vulgaris]|uniref:Uncharacterized protein LOC124819215 n=1 Tax=Hydra vulgaris TaxID=6087 RepID=A0ABM4DIY4_HYDVU
MKTFLIPIQFFLIIFIICVCTINTEDIPYEHSRNYRLIEDDTAWENLINDWTSEAEKDLSGLHEIKRSSLAATVTPSIEKIKEFIQTFEPAFKKAQKNIQNIVKSSAVLTGRLKAAYSVQGKLKNDGNGLEDLKDIIGLRLTCQTVKDSLQITKAIKEDKTNFEILEEKCYGMCPGAEKYKKGGYRRIHLILRLKPENKPAELQIGTPFTNYWADWSHDFIYKGPAEITNQSTVQNYSILLADYFLKLDNERDKMPICPAILNKSNALDILKKAIPNEKDAVKMFNKVNHPPNACFWWYDMLLALPEKTCCKQDSSHKKQNHLHERRSSQKIQGFHEHRKKTKKNQVNQNLDFIGGHTRDYILLDDKLNSWDKLLSNWQREAKNNLWVRRSSSGVSQIPTLPEIEKFIKTHKQAFDSAQKNIKSIVNSSAVLTGRLKAAYSVQGKLEKDKTTLQELNDIIGLRLTCQTVNEALRITDAIKKDKKNFEILNEKCYGMCPNAGKYKEGGYRRIHLILRLIQGNKTAELQIGTPYTNYWSDWSHDFIYKGPTEISKSTEVNSYSLALADYFLISDTSRSNLPLCPTFLKNANAMKILNSSLPSADAEKMFKKIGEPPNGCFWWYDMKLGQ